MTQNIPLEGPKMAVQSTYTETQVLRDLQRKKAIGRSLRDISKDYDGISHGVIQRALKGQFPKSPHKRLALGLPTLIPAPACTKCGQVHTTKRCPNGKKPAKNWRDGEAWWARLLDWLNEMENTHGSY
jgi:hypothetical protein